MDDVLNYYNKLPQVSLGAETPTISPELIASVLASRQQLPAASAQQQPQADPYADRVKQQQAQGMGMQIPAQAFNPEFPEYAYTLKKTSLDNARKEQEARKLAELSKYIGAPEHEFKQLEKIYDGEINLYYPQMKDFEEVNKNVSELKKEITPLVTKRNTWISGLASYASQADESTMLPGESEKDWAQRISPTLLAQLKLYNTALAGSSDALSSQEVSRLVGGQLPETYFTVGNLLRANADVTKGNIKAFQSKLQQLHDILLNQTNDAFNTLAAQSSPKYATQSLGYAQSDFLSAENALKRSMRIDDTADAKVIRGQQTMAQMFLQKKEQDVERETELAIKAINAGKSKEAVKQMFKKNTGRDLKLNE